jgi:hypothetical protein
MTMTEFPALGIIESESKRADETDLVDEGAFGDEVVDWVFWSIVTGHSGRS